MTEAWKKAGDDAKDICLSKTSRWSWRLWSIESTPSMWARSTSLTRAMARDSQPMHPPTRQWLPRSSTNLKKRPVSTWSAFSRRRQNNDPHTDRCQLRRPFCSHRSHKDLLIAVVSAVKHLLYICGPNEVLIFSGGTSRRWRSRWISDCERRHEPPPSACRASGSHGPDQHDRRGEHRWSLFQRRHSSRGSRSRQPESRRPPTLASQRTCAFWALSRRDHCDCQKHT